MVGFNEASQPLFLPFFIRGEEQLKNAVEHNSLDLGLKKGVHPNDTVDVGGIFVRVSE